MHNAHIQILLFHHIDSSWIRVRCLLANCTAARHCCSTAFAVYNPMRNIEYHFVQIPLTSPTIGTKHLYGNGKNSESKWVRKKKLSRVTTLFFTSRYLTGASIHLGNENSNKNLLTISQCHSFKLKTERTEQIKWICGERIITKYIWKKCVSVAVCAHQEWKQTKKYRQITKQYWTVQKHHREDSSKVNLLIFIHLFESRFNEKEKNLKQIA